RDRDFAKAFGEKNRFEFVEQPVVTRRRRGFVTGTARFHGRQDTLADLVPNRLNRYHELKTRIEAWIDTLRPEPAWGIESESTSAVRSPTTCCSPPMAKPARTRCCRLPTTRR